MTSEIIVRPMADADRDAWDAFVRSDPDGTFFHLSGWRYVISGAYRHPTHYLFAEREGAMTGVLPLARMRHPLFGDALISTPFCVYGGPLGDDTSRQALQRAATELAERLRVDHLEFRLLTPGNAGWPRKDLYYRFRKAIDADPDKNLAAIPRKQRAMVRKGINGGLESTLEDGIDNLFNAYSQSVRNLGTPVFPRRYFSLLREVFGADCDVVTITHGGKLVASVMNFYFRDEVLPYYGGGTAAARSLYGNDFMYWEVMRRAAERGVRIFDYGRSKKDTGSYRFKKHWGFEPEPLSYEYYLVKAKAVPDLNPNNPKYRLFIDAWKRLPLPVTRWLGPMLSSGLG